VLPELAALDALLEAGEPWLERSLLCEVDAPGVDAPQRLPVHAYRMGSADPGAPAVGFFGGVHGLERIGSEAVVTWLRQLVARLRWDDSLHQVLSGLRLVFMPLVNPGGVLAGTRANPRGVDLMRNAPVESRDAVPFLVGGQRLSPALPWYRGAAGEPMEAESSALCRLVAEELMGRPFGVAIDCHSGFGLRDRLWLPYAHTARPIAHLAEAHALSELLDTTLPHHRYLVEPQSHQYLAHGDLWDHLYDQSLARGDGIFLPLTLEMGSWGWVRKNPRQLFSRHGIFNPVLPHRQARVLRQHLAWFDLVMRAAASHARWLPRGAERRRHEQRALDRWYRSRMP
jgi:hypothetical protein